MISPLGNPLHCAKKIAECETVISSSLHGLIAADSFGIPNLQMVLSNNIVGGLFKYNDYYSVFKTHARPLTGKDIINNGITAQDIRAGYTISAGLVSDVQGQLLSCFPKYME